MGLPRQRLGALTRSYPMEMRQARKSSGSIIPFRFCGT